MLVNTNRKRVNSFQGDGSDDQLEKMAEFYFLSLRLHVSPPTH